ncbi:MAG: L-glutamate gamma-semialdehyde dehydrogenase, partial [Candidatus Obscuribacterales bacterium]|nr:L-glutamate gamma-semialdehyde dehydrogenase [Candidatus Obscuribacterales bacterium]
MPTTLPKETVKGNLTEYKPESFTDFSLPENEKAIKEALKTVEAQLGRQYPLVINGEHIETSEQLVSTNPSRPAQVIGKFSKATKDHADKAMTAALAAFETWKKVAPEERAEYLFKAAKIMKTRRHELSAWLILEIGKNWAEADADVAEAIDFCEYYGREMLRLANPAPLTPMAGESNKLSYIPLGVGLVIPPWNFPLAILVGMTTASIVAGNTVILKPSSDTPGIAFQFIKILEEVGLPKGVVNFVPGPGASVGDYLVAHPKTRFIAFTGSKEVGLHINELAAKTHPGQIWIKRVVAEMGGKDGIVVDADANLDEAAEGIVAAAFGFGGQKCSACSRAILHKDIYDALLEKIVDRTKKLVLGKPEDKSSSFGPVASKSAYEGILKYIEIGKGEGRLMTGGKAHENPDNGFFIEPTVIADIKPEARISLEEIFGPVLAVIKADSWDHAMQIANNTEFGLTGAVYTNNKQHLEEARENFHVGNLYLNRKCTGAIVGVHPFGGFNMSGTDSKAGGPDYLLLFSQA